jgi:hypothetical protein
VHHFIKKRLRRNKRVCLKKRSLRRFTIGVDLGGRTRCISRLNVYSILVNLSMGTRNRGSYNYG